MRLLVGLGNPGAQFERTRHNAGFQCLDAVAATLASPSWKAFKGGELAQVGGGLLYKPTLFINRSGLPIRQVMDFYKIDVADVCILADEVYLEPGSARIRRGGADGGHNGWKSVIEHLGAEGYLRVRLGVGPYAQRPEDRQHQPPLDHFVLQPMPHSDAERLAQLIDRLVPDLVGWLESGAMPEHTLHL